MSSFLISVVAVVFVLGTIVLLHEFGHYMAAKSLGVRVEVFSLGFGKRLLGFHHGETDYRISALPFGGYVRMSGENPLETRSGDPREFLSHPRWHRFLIALAGPGVNILLAVALLTGVYMVRYEHPAFEEEPARVGWVMENSPAEKAGILPGDLIVRIDGVQNPTWEDERYREVINTGQAIDIAVQRGNQILTKTLVPQKVGPDEVGYAGLEPQQKLIITEMESTMPAAKAGMKIGDQILAINGVPIQSLPGLLRGLRENKDRLADIAASRNGQELHFRVTPVQSQIEGETYYRIGISSNPMRIDKLSFAVALRKSLDDNQKSSGLVLDLMTRMIQRKVSIRLMSGPIGMARVSGEVARQPGWTPLLRLMAMISLQLGIFNLFPIPILDGGIILLLLLEGLMRRDISLRVKERIYQAAFLFLVLFAMLVIYNDLAKTIPGLGRP